VGVLDVIVLGGNVGRIIEWYVTIVNVGVVVAGSVGRIIEWYVTIVNVGMVVGVNVNVVCMLVIVTVY